MGVFELSRKDREILFELSLNARLSITKLAKKVGLSKQVVSYRLGLLEKNKIILGYHAITNVYLLGKTHYRVFIKYQNMSSEKEEEFMDYLLKKPEIVWIAYLDGELDAAFLVWADNIMEFEKVYDEINQKFGAYFQEKHFSIATKIEYLKYKFLANRNDSFSLVFGNCFAQNKLDNLDGKILNILNRNCRETLVNIAAECNSSPKVISTRIARLKKNKIIVGFNIKINHNRLGYTHRKVLLKLNDNSKEKINELSKYLKNQKSVIFLVKPIGDYDFEFELITESNDEFHRTIKDLRSNFADNIKNYSTFTFYYEPKSGQKTNF